MTRSILAIIALALLALPSNADAENNKKQAAEQVKKAKAHFNLQEYDRAEAALKEAYRLDPRPETLYAIAQAQRMGKACDRAIISYKNYLRTKPRKDLADAAKENIARCEAMIAEPTPAPEPAPEPPAVEAAPAAVVAPEPTPAPNASALPSHPDEHAPNVAEGSGMPWTRNWLGHALLAGGLACVAAGTVVALGADATIRDINDAQFYDDFVARSADLDAARSRRTLGYVAAGAGGAFVVGAILVYVLRSPDDASTRSARIGLDPRGAIQLAWEY